MIIGICAQQATYECFFGLVGERICLLDKDYICWFERSFQHQYEDTHRLENVKLRNVAKFFAHLLATNSIRWSVYIHY
jgi:pre-mRNA-splicing factor CWC22